MKHLRHIKKFRKVFSLILFEVANMARCFYLKRKGNVTLGRRVLLHKFPMVDMDSESTLWIGDHVTLNSSNRSYHVNMFGKTKLFVEGSGKISIGSRTRIHGTCIHARCEVRIGKRCLIGANCQIMDSNGHEVSSADISNRINTRGKSKLVVIEDDVWLGVGVVVLPGAHICKGSVCSANSVVSGHIDAGSIVAGNPAKVLRKIKHPNL